jgi:hypothetical protein
VEGTAHLLRDMAAADELVDWWQRGAPRDYEQERS